MTNLDEAINFYERQTEELYKAIPCDGCAFDKCKEERRQLAEWLRKLKTFEEAKESIIEVSWEHTFTFSDESEPMTYKICALDTVLEILGGKR